MDTDGLETNGVIAGFPTNHYDAVQRFPRWSDYPFCVLIELGVTYREVSITTLGRLSDNITGLAQTLVASSAIDGALALSTCNRFELYLDAPAYHPAIDAVHEALVSHNKSDDLTDRHVDLLEQQAVRHLFAVASGLDAMVVGEAEISGQLNRALKVAQQTQTLTPLLQRLTQNALRCAKEVASRTELGAVGRSTAGVGLDLAAEHLPPWERTTTVMVGTGAIARVAATALHRRGGDKLAVFSPTGKATAFAERHRARIIDHAGLPHAVATADLLFAGSGHATASFTPEVCQAIAKRPKPLVIVDLSVPADVPTHVASLPAVRYIHLADVAQAGPSASIETVETAYKIVDQASTAFSQAEAVRNLDPAIIALRQHIENLAAKELARLRSKVGEQAAHEFELSLHRFTQSLLHQPMQRAQLSVLPAEQRDYLHALHLLFGIDLETKNL